MVGSVVALVERSRYSTLNRLTAVLVHSSHELVDEFRKLFAELSRILIDFHGFLRNVASSYCSARLPISDRIEVDVSLSRRGQLRLPLRWLT